MSLSKIITKFSLDTNNTAYFNTFDTPVGKATAVADDKYLYLVCFDDTKNIEKKVESVSKELKCKFVEEKNKTLLKFEKELSDYFDGKLTKFTVPIKTCGSEFQNSVWAKLLDVPYGTTQTYADMAESLGRASSHSRAVGSACGANPLLLVVPCHRLVASGSTGGFSSGTDRKDKLLQHEHTFSKLDS